MATLVHDDVLDAAPLRRGLPTVVATSGRERAIAVGDLLLLARVRRARAGRWPRGASGRAARRARRSGSRWASSRSATTLSTYGSAPSATSDRCRLKTARLFECACLVGRAADPDPAADALTVYGREIGLAFQLLDDVLDVAGPPERTGKARGTDLLDGTVTLPLILARERDPELLDLDLARARRQRGRGGVRPDRRDRSARGGRADEAREPASRSVAQASDRSCLRTCDRTRQRGSAGRLVGRRSRRAATPRSLRAGSGPRRAPRRRRSIALLHVRPGQQLEVVQDGLACRRRAPRRSGRPPPGHRRRRRSTRTRDSAERRSIDAGPPAPSRRGRRSPGRSTGRRSCRRRMRIGGRTCLTARRVELRLDAQPRPLFPVAPRWSDILRPIGMSPSVL